jgi:hypothetical protein
MKLVALTYGTEGDTRPVAALCRALMDAGYDVTLLADRGTLGSARDLGVPPRGARGRYSRNVAVGQQHFIGRCGEEQPERYSTGARTHRQRER